MFLKFFKNLIILNPPFHKGGFFLASIHPKLYTTNMIYLLVGNKKDRKDKVQALMAGNTGTIIYAEDIGEGGLSNHVQTQAGMFGDREYYVIYNYARDIKKDELAEYSQSENIFIFSEETITKPVRALFEKVTAEIIEFSEEAKESDKKFNMFSLTDAFLNRDKKTLWLLFQEALKNGSPEEIHGILFWQLKNMILVKTSPENPGLQSFVYTKTKKGVEKFSLEDLSLLNQKFLEIFHKRDNYSTLDIELEKIVLSL